MLILLSGRIVNLALALARDGLQTGILDTDIFGPSIPTLLNLSGEPRLSADNQLVPMTNYGLKSMSMGYLVPEDSAVVWRGLMVMKALQQLLHQVAWGDLDVLVLDLPPGTGDVQLTISQQVILDGKVPLQFHGTIGTDGLDRSGDSIHASRHCSQGRSQRSGNVQKSQRPSKTGTMSGVHLDKADEIADPRHGPEHVIIHMPQLSQHAQHIW